MNTHTLPPEKPERYSFLQRVHEAGTAGDGRGRRRQRREEEEEPRERPRFARPRSAAARRWTPDWCSLVCLIDLADQMAAAWEDVKGEAGAVPEPPAPAVPLSLSARPAPARAEGHTIDPHQVALRGVLDPGTAPSAPEARPHPLDVLAALGNRRTFRLA